MITVFKGDEGMAHNVLAFGEEADFEVPHVRYLSPLLMAIGKETKRVQSRHIGKASFNPDPSGNRQFIVGAVICSYPSDEAHISVSGILG